MSSRKEKKVIGMTFESEKAPVLPEALSENPDPLSRLEPGEGSGHEPGGDQTFPVRTEPSRS